MLQRQLKRPQARHLQGQQRHETARLAEPMVLGGVVVAGGRRRMRAGLDWVPSGGWSGVEWNGRRRTAVVDWIWWGGRAGAGLYGTKPGKGTRRGCVSAWWS
jgi:hypothetical protein